MGGNKSGGLKSRDKNLAKDPDYYRKLGKIGGLTPKTKPAGFAAMDPKKRSEAGRRGGTISSRTRISNGEGKSRSARYTKRKKELDEYLEPGGLPTILKLAELIDTEELEIPYVYTAEWLTKAEINKRLRLEKE